MNKPVDPVKFIVEATGVAHWLPVIVSPGEKIIILPGETKQSYDDGEGDHKRMVRTIIRGW